MLNCLMILNACLCTAAVDLNIEEVAIADPACEKSAADFGLRDEPVEVKIREIVGRLLIPLVDMRQLLLEIAIKGLNLQILVYLSHINTKR